MTLVYELRKITSDELKILPLANSSLSLISRGFFLSLCKNGLSVETCEESKK